MSRMVGFISPSDSSATLALAADRQHERGVDMPEAIAIAYGLDWETEIKSFWSWMEDARSVLEEGREPSSLVRELVAEQQAKIDEVAAKEKDPETARLLFRTAVAIIGLHYASNQKLLAALRDEGLFVSSGPGPLFDTIKEPGGEGIERPR
jgi:hypothetical protein